MAEHEIDLDAIVAKRRESTGDSDNLTFSFAGGQWSIPHPLFADDEFKEGLQDVEETDVEVARYYMGEEQYEKFRAVGGRAGYVGLLLAEVQQRLQDEQDDRPTRRSTSSAPSRRRSKRR